MPQRYPTLHCEAHDSYSDEGPAGPPDCHGHVGDVGLWISEDPVQLVTIASVEAGMGGVFRAETELAQASIGAAAAAAPSVPSTSRMSPERQVKMGVSRSV